MKKLISLIAVLAMLVCTFPASVGAYEIGDVVGYALETDIAATINGYDIPSYNVDGYTYIVVEDLRYYGFDVVYDDASRSLFVTRNPSQTEASKTYTKPIIPSGKLGSRAYSLLYTDIVTYLDGVNTMSYNINGQTIIPFDSLNAYGIVSYDDSRREISLTLPDFNTNPLSSFIVEYGVFFADTLEQTYADSGINTTCTVRATGDTFVLGVSLEDFANLSSVERAGFIEGFDTTSEANKSAFAIYKTVYPTLTKVQFNIVDKFGNEIYSPIIYLS